MFRLTISRGVLRGGGGRVAGAPKICGSGIFHQPGTVIAISRAMMRESKIIVSGTGGMEMRTHRASSALRGTYRYVSAGETQACGKTRWVMVRSPAHLVAITTTICIDLDELPS